MSRIITLTPNPTYDFAVDAPFVEANRKLRCKNPQVHPGGGGINVARAALRLGAHVTAVLTTGGVYGDAVKALLAEEKVPFKAITIAGQTRIAFHVRDLAGDEEYRFNLPGHKLTTAEADTLLAAVIHESREGDYIIGSGSLPGGGPADFWARAAFAAKQNNARFVLDSINGVQEALDEGIFLLRQNKHEYPALAGRELQWPEEIMDFAKSLVAQNKAEKVTISHGGDGAIMASKDGVAKVTALPVKAQSAVGAGDSFVAAVVTAFTLGWSDKDAIGYGISAAAATRLKSGSALFSADDVERLYKEM